MTEEKDYSHVGPFALHSLRRVMVLRVDDEGGKYRVYIGKRPAEDKPKLYQFREITIDDDGVSLYTGKEFDGMIPIVYEFTKEDFMAISELVAKTMDKEKKA